MSKKRSGIGVQKEELAIQIGRFMTVERIERSPSYFAIAKTSDNWM